VTRRLLDMLPLGVIVTSATRRILFVNETARRTLLQADAIVESNGRLLAAEPSRGRALCALIERIAASPAGTAEFAAVARPYGDPILSLVRSLEPGLALILVRNPEIKYRLTTKDFGPLYELTGAESRLLGALLQGSSLKSYARSAQVTHNTARKQLQAIFEKTGFGRQAALVGGLLSDPLLHFAKSVEEG